MKIRAEPALKSTSKRGNFYWHLVTSEDLQSLILMIMQSSRPFGGYQEMKLTLCVLYIYWFYLLSVTVFPSHNPPAQLKQSSTFCFDLILRGKFKRSKIAFLVDGAEANVGQPNTIQNSDVEKENWTVNQHNEWTCLFCLRKHRNKRL